MIKKIISRLFSEEVGNIVQAEAEKRQTLYEKRYLVSMSLFKNIVKVLPEANKTSTCQRIIPKTFEFRDENGKSYYISIKGLERIGKRTLGIKLLLRNEDTLNIFIPLCFRNIPTVCRGVDLEVKTHYWDLTATLTVVADWLGIKIEKWAEGMEKKFGCYNVYVKSDCSEAVISSMNQNERTKEFLIWMIKYLDAQIKENIIALDVHPDYYQKSSGRPVNMKCFFAEGTNINPKLVRKGEDNGWGDIYEIQINGKKIIARHEDGGYSAFMRFEDYFYTK